MSFSISWVETSDSRCNNAARSSADVLTSPLGHELICLVPLHGDFDGLNPGSK